MSVRESGLHNSQLMLREGEFRVLQICYSNGSNPYLTGLAPVIPPPELRGEDRTKIIAAIPPTHNPKQNPASPNSPANAEYIKHAHPRGGLQSPSHKANGPAGITHWAARTARCTTSSSAPPVQSSSLRIPPPQTPPCLHRTAGSASRPESRRSACPGRYLLREGLLLRCRSSRKSGRPSSYIQSLQLLRSRRTLLWFSALIRPVCPFFGRGGDPQYYRNLSNGPLTTHAASPQNA